MSFNDIFKSGFLAKAGGVTADPLLLAISIVLIVFFAIAIRFVYKLTYRGVMFSRTFGTALSMVVLVTGFVIMTISSNVILSLGMVGALSIIRFRTAVKDAMDITYMFWAVGLGISCGAGLFIIAGLLFVVVAVVLFVTGKEGVFTQPYLFIFACKTEEQEREILKFLNTAVKRTKLKSKIITGHNRELTIEVGILKGNTDFVSRISSMAGVDSASLLSYDGEFTA